MNTETKLALRVVSGPDAGKTFLLPETSFIGSLRQCEIQLTDPGIEPMHARIGRRGEAYTISDLTNKSGIRINGQTVMSRRLAMGDTIGIAGTELKVVTEEDTRFVPKTSREPRVPAAAIHVVSTERDPVAGKTADLMLESRIATMKPPTLRLPRDDNPTPPRVRGVEVDMTVTEEIMPVAPPEPMDEPAPARGQLMDEDLLERSRSAGVIRPERSDARVTRYLTVFGVAVVVVAAVGFFYMRARTLRAAVVERFRQVEEFARSNPDKIEEQIDRFNRLRPEANRVHAVLNGEIIRRLAGLEAEKEARTRKFDLVLVGLDARAQRLASEERFAEALAVYEENPDAGLRARIMAARELAIQNLRRLRGTHAAKAIVEKEEATGKQKVADEGKSRETLRKIADTIVDAMIAGQGSEAVQQLCALAADSDLAFAKERAGAALATAELLVSMDKQLVALQGDKIEVPGRGVVPDKANLAAIDDLHPTLKAVYAIRRDDVLAAQGFLKQAEGHILYDSLMARVRMSDEDLQKETAAIRSCAAAWRAITREVGERLPNPTDCVTALRKACQERDRREIIDRLQELIRTADTHAGTHFVRKYAGLFDAARDLAAGLNLVGHASGLGDAKVLQAEGSMFFAELRESAADGQNRGVGLFREKMVFFKPQGDTPVLAQVEVHSVVPGRMLSDRQISFVFFPGTNTPPPLIGDMVLVGKAPRLGEQYLASSALMTPSVKKPADGGESRILGLSASRREVVISRGSEAGWASAIRGQPVYFLRDKGAGNFDRQATGKIEAVGTGWLVCRLAEGQALVGDCIGSLTPQTEAASKATPRETAAPGPASGSRVRAAPAFVYGVALNQSAAGTISVQVASSGAGALPAKGYLAVVKDGVQHPHTREVLAVWCGESVRCDMTAQDKTVSCQLPAGLTLGEKASKGVVLSGAAIPSDRLIDIEGESISFSKSGLSGAFKCWEMLHGRWRDKMGRFTSVPPSADDGVPVLGLATMFGGNAQFDVELQIEKAGVAEGDWTRDVVIELSFPVRNEAVAFGVGLGKDQEVQVTGAASVIGKDGKLGKPGVLPAQAVVTVTPCCPQGGSLLKIGKDYAFRVRKVQETISFYINGKRLAVVQWPGLESDAQFRLTAPKATLVMSKAGARAISSTGSTPEKEPVLGEFGYVAWTDGSQIYFDSDLAGIGPGRTVTVLAVDKVVQGDASMSVLTRRVGTALITDIGPRVCRAVTAQGGKFEKGMKVMVGTFPSANPIFTDMQLNDLEQGL